MMRLVLIVALSLAATPPAAQGTGDADGDSQSMIEDGARQLFEGLMQELGPALEGLTQDLGQFAREMGPAFQDLLDQVEDWSAYHPPEVLPNGDIIIRRKQEAPPPRTGPDGSIEL